MSDDRRGGAARTDETRIDRPTPSPDIEPPGRSPEIPAPPQEPRPGTQRPGERPDVQPPDPNRYEPPEPDEVEPPERREREGPRRPEERDRAARARLDTVVTVATVPVQAPPTPVSAGLRSR